MNHVLQVGFKNNKRHVICGDFNIDVSKDNEDSCDLLEQLNSLNFTLITDKYDPTRIGLKSKSTIVLVFANFDSKTDVRIHSVTDHYGVILSTTMQTYTPKQTCFESRNWKKLERVQTRLEFNSLIKEKIQERITGHENAKEMLTVIEQSILEALDKVVPCKKITPRQEDRKWITNQVKNSCTKKQAAWIRFANQRTDELYDKFKQQRNKTKKL